MGPVTVSGRVTKVSGVPARRVPARKTIIASSATLTTTTIPKAAKIAKTVTTPSSISNSIGTQLKTEQPTLPLLIQNDMTESTSENRSPIPSIVQYIRKLKQEPTWQEDVTYKVSKNVDDILALCGVARRLKTNGLLPKYERQCSHIERSWRKLLPKIEEELEKSRAAKRRQQRLGRGRG